MQVIVDISEKIVEQAESRGLRIETYVKQIVDQAAESDPAHRYGWTRFGTPGKAPSEAAESIRQIASRNTLGGLKIKDLIHEGHKY